MPQAPRATVSGVVLSERGSPIAKATVTLQQEGLQTSQRVLTDNRGAFTFSVFNDATYSLLADKDGKESPPSLVVKVSLENQPTLTLLIDQHTDKPAAPKLLAEGTAQFADQPEFTVAGITDFTAAGGHGSDSSLRTSETLAAKASTLKADDSVRNASSTGAGRNPPDIIEAVLRSKLQEAPDSFEANRRLGVFYLDMAKPQQALTFLESAYRIDNKNQENEYDLALSCKAIGDYAHSRKYVQHLMATHPSADLYHLAAELDERLGDPLAAVNEAQKAVSLEPTEQNIFSWGSELLTHRAIWQAQQVFEQGVKQYPQSSRMRTGLGTALFAGGAYEKAAANLCSASDLNVLDPDPYLFMGKVQVAAPKQLGCIEQRLKRFVQQQPDDAAANYFYAMALRKRSDFTATVRIQDQTTNLLQKTIAIDPAYADAYLQLGNLSASRNEFSQAIEQYTRAIAADPKLSDAYYRLAIAYDHTGEAAKAKEEFRLHDKVAAQQAEEVERQREEVKQFVVLLPTQPSAAQTP